MNTEYTVSASSMVVPRVPVSHHLMESLWPPLAAHLPLPTWTRQALANTIKRFRSTNRNMERKHVNQTKKWLPSTAHIEPTVPWLVYGLGNGHKPQYQNTPHNAGQVVVNKLALKLADVSLWKLHKVLPSMPADMVTPFNTVVRSDHCIYAVRRDGSSVSVVAVADCSKRLRMNDSGNALRALLGAVLRQYNDMQRSALFHIRKAELCRRLIVVRDDVELQLGTLHVSERHHSKNADELHNGISDVLRVQPHHQRFVAVASVVHSTM